ncbi:MAG: hypothetical protein A3K19_11650 [Lentisphaerae bacterium RIFOXYB12_FULL_65_16]|nr:MAG: hypothetical protein A3K18_32415 [Lentisphaerae bacterium RIFOXYA12_64_32]OGV92412.1 MAG: hypothetical protein A3K19_11650 [Lentisphaerae bacterium RIFOXYB12_FULL_65_16]
MIQVVKRVAGILEALRGGQALSLKPIADRVGIESNTAWNILDSLAQVGWVRKLGGGVYTLGPELYRLAAASADRDVLRAAAARRLDELSRATQEGAVVTVLEDGEPVVIAESSCERSLVVSPGACRRGSLYEWSSGRILLASLNTEGLSRVVARHGLPGAAWPEAAGSQAKLEAQLAKVRAAQLAFGVSADGEVRSAAVPVSEPGDAVIAAIGIHVPTLRFKGKNRQRILDALKAAAAGLAADCRLAASTTAERE